MPGVDKKRRIRYEPFCTRPLFPPPDLLSIESFFEEGILKKKQG